MTRITLSLFIATLLGIFLHVASAQAQLVRTCVSLAKGSEDAKGGQYCGLPGVVWSYEYVEVPNLESEFIERLKALEIHANEVLK